MYYFTNTTVFEFLEATQAKKTSLRKKKIHTNLELQPRYVFLKLSLKQIGCYVCLITEATRKVSLLKKSLHLPYRKDDIISSSHFSVTMLALHVHFETMTHQAVGVCEYQYSLSP